MATKTIKQLDNELFATGMTLSDIDIEVENSTGSFKSKLSEVRTKFVENIPGTVYASTLPLSLVSPNDVGGISEGTTVGQLTGKTFTQLFDDLLFPTVYPTFVNPSNTFTDNANDLQEVSYSITILFTITYDAGSILLDEVKVSDRAGAVVSPNGYNYTGSGLTAHTSYNTQTLTGYLVLQGIQTWSGSTNYTQGVQPYDNKGNPYSTPLPAGTTTIQTTSIEGVYPLFGTTSSISNPNTKQTLVSMITGNNIVISMVAESGGNKQSFDLPVPWTTSRPLSTVQTYNTVSHTWETTGLSSWTTSSVTHSVQGNTINYTRYTYNGSDRGSIDIRLVF